MSIQTQIDRIRGAVTNAKAALTAKGVTVPEEANVESLAELISEMEVGGGLEMELLWENASPESEFAAQTISLDLSGFDAYEIVYYVHASKKAQISTGILPVVVNSIGAMIGLYAEKTNATSNDVDFAWRYYTITNSGCSFYGGFANDLAGEDGSESNNKFCVPVAIYGIKGVTA